MSTAPSITARVIREHVGERNYRLGEQYHGEGAVFDARREGDTLKARCEGSSGGPYRVEATLAGGRVVEADCSCPVGGGGSCKHVAAVLLAWLHDPGDFREVEAADAALERRSKA